MRYLFGMKHGSNETCKQFDWQFSQSQAEKLGQDVTMMKILTMLMFLVLQSVWQWVWLSFEKKTETLHKYF